jgi:anti-anti-sigma regulatory factor
MAASPMRECAGRSTSPARTGSSRGGTLPLTVDLTGVTHLASAGVRALYQVREQLAAHQQDLTLVAAPGSSAGVVLELVRLPHVGG